MHKVAEAVIDSLIPAIVQVQEDGTAKSLIPLSPKAMGLQIRQSLTQMTRRLKMVAPLKRKKTEANHHQNRRKTLQKKQSLKESPTKAISPKTAKKVTSKTKTKNQGPRTKIKTRTRHRRTVIKVKNLLRLKKKRAKARIKTKVRNNMAILQKIKMPSLRTKTIRKM